MKLAGILWVTFRQAKPTELSCRYASSEVLVGWSNSFRNPHTFLTSDWGGCALPFLSLSETSIHAHVMLWLVSCAKVRKEPRFELLSLKLFFFSFIPQLFLSRFMWTTQCNTMDAFQGRLSRHYPHIQTISRFPPSMIFSLDIDGGCSKRLWISDMVEHLPN